MTRILIFGTIFVIFNIVNGQVAKSTDSTCNDELMDEKIDANFIDTDEKSIKILSHSSTPWKFSSIHRRLMISFKFPSIVKSIFLRGSIAAYNISYRYSDEKLFWNPIFDRKGFPEIFRSTDSGVLIKLEFPIVASHLQISPIDESNVLTILDVKISGCKSDAKCFHFDPAQSQSSCLIYDLEQRGYIVSIKNHLTFRLKTFQSNGILLSSHGNQHDLILISIRAGRIDVLIDFGGQCNLCHSTCRQIFATDAILAGSRIASQVTGMIAVNDGNWHRVDLFHDERDVVLYIDGMRFNETQSYGANYRLDLDRKIYIGCAQLVRPMLPFIGAMKNFTGYLNNLTLNDQNLMDTKNLKTNTQTKNCSETSRPPSIAFTGSAGWIEKVKIPFENQTQIKFWLRTFSKNAIFLSTKPSEGRLTEISLEIREGKLNLALSGFGDTVLIRSAAEVADSLWHIVEVNITSNYCSLRIDDTVIHRAEASFSFKSPKKFRFGGQGFGGCLREVKINSKVQEFFETDPHSTEGISWSTCNFRDHCRPNPCFNGGSCTPKLNGFECTCLSGYLGTTCESINLPKSCQEFFDYVQNSTESETIFLDMDGAGPLPPIKVTCQRSGAKLEDRVVRTSVEHDRPSPVNFAGFSGRGDGQMVLNYDAPRSALLEIVKRHEFCRQEMIFECFGGTKIMNSPSLTSGPPTWWMGFSAIHIHSWGAADPGTRSCDCALTGTCLNAKSCNCDSGQDAIDAGNVTNREHLPIRRIFVGDTNFFGKRARISIGRLICEDYSFRKPVTVRTLNGFLTLNETFPSKKENSTVEIYFEFLTTLKSFTLLSNHPIDSFDFLSIYYTGGNLVLEMVSSGTVLFLNQSIDLSNNRWHSVYAVVAEMEAQLIVDHLTNMVSRFTGSLAKPNLSSSWRLGASIEYGSIFAGAFRSVVINGVDYDLPSTIVDPEGQGIVAGLRKRCDGKHFCSNGGICVEFYTHFECDCSSTPFEGPFCSRDVSFDLSEHQLGPYTVYSMLLPIMFRIGFALRTKKSTVLLRSYVDDRTKLDVFSLKFTPKGIMQMSLNYGKKSLVFNDTRFEFNDGSFFDVSLKILTNFLIWQVGHYEPLKFFVDNAESFKKGKSFWIVGDSNFVGCVSKLKIGDDLLPLKSVQSIKTKGIARSVCSSSSDQIPMEFDRPYYAVPPEVERSLPKLVIRPVDKSDRSFLVGVCSAIGIFCAILLFCCVYRCWRTRPSGEYKTHEDQLIYMTGDSSQQALVPSNRVQSPRREWFI